MSMQGGAKDQPSVNLDSYVTPKPTDVSKIGDQERVSDPDTSISQKQEVHIPITQETSLNLVHRNAPHITH